jgi:hypothetical protein
MCIEKQSLGTALLPLFASDVGYDVQLLQLLSAYQKNPGTETYNAVQDFLLEKRKQKQTIMNTFNNDIKFAALNLHILDYEANLLWSTSPLKQQDKIVLLYQASEYTNQATQGSSYKKFEDASEFSLAWVSGSPLFLKGGAFIIGGSVGSTSCSDYYCSILCEDANPAYCTSFYQTNPDNANEATFCELSNELCVVGKTTCSGGINTNNCCSASGSSNCLYSDLFNY